MALLCGAAAGCAVGPKYTKPIPSPPTEFKAPAPWKVADPADGAEKGEWWRVFGDSRLAKLETRAAEASPTVRAAFHRVEEARATVRIDRAGLYPTLFAGAGGNKTRGSGSSSGFAAGRTRATVSLPLDLQYELDLWGRLRRGVEAAEADADAAEADFRNTLLTLQTDLALLYFRLRALDAEQGVLDSAVETREKTLSLVRARFNAGDVAELDVAQAETELSAARAEAIGLERERRRLENALAVLCGEVASDFRIPVSPLEKDPPAAPAAWKTDLLERRPDVAAAERAMAAATARVGVAEAAFFPSVRLGSSLSLESRALNLLFNSGSAAWSLFGDLSQPLVDGGERAARHEAARAILAETGENYRLAVLNAIRDVEDALSALDVLGRQAAAQGETTASARRTVEIAEKRYQSGFVAYFEVVDAQRALLRAEQEAVRLRGDRHAAAVALVKALGGDW